VFSHLPKLDLLSCGVFSLSLLAVAQPIKTHAQNVVYDSGKTVDATRYYARRLRSGETPGYENTLPPAPARPERSLNLANNLPLLSAQLEPGQLEVREVVGLYAPFFVIGMDRQSLGWFEEAADTLAAMNATGFVVQADNRDEWLELKAHAQEHGIKVALLNGNGLAQMYGFNTYPTVFVGRGDAQ
jgi:integrating conjugative element protein (TIGR03765 family)